MSRVEIKGKIPDPALVQNAMLDKGTEAMQDAMGRVAARYATRSGRKAKPIVRRSRKRVTGRVRTDFVGILLEKGTGVYGFSKQPIKPKRGKFLKFKHEGRTILVREVKGTPAKNYMRDTMAETKPMVLRTLEEAADGVVRSVSTKGFG